MVDYTSAFLSHSHSDQPLVKAVATELGKRGIVAWLDKDDLYPGQNLVSALKKAIHEQATWVVFLSEEALQSTWVNAELETALDHFEKTQQEDRIKPVFLSDPLQLVSGNRLLANRWMNEKGNEVSKLGITTPSPTTPEKQARDIADRIAVGVYASLSIDRSRNVIINLDQRGSKRIGKPQGIPPNHGKVDGPALVFRPQRGIGREKETIVGEEWLNLASDIRQALQTAFISLRWADQKNIYLSGHAQLGLAYLIGHHFNRSSDAVLYCTDTRGVTFSNEGWDKTDMLSGGHAHCEANADAKLPAIPGAPFEEVALIVGRQNIAKGVLPYLNATRPRTPIAWVRMPQRLQTSDQVKTLIADVTALAQRLKRENGCRTTYLVLGLPFAATPLFAAHMPYVLDRFVLLEYRADVAGQVDDAETYAELSFPA